MNLRELFDNKGQPRMMARPPGRLPAREVAIRAARETGADVYICIESRSYVVRNSLEGIDPRDVLYVATPAGEVRRHRSTHPSTP